MLTQFLEQRWAKHHVAIFTSLATLDVNYHALTVDVRNFQVGKLGPPHSGSVERHQKRALEALPEIFHYPDVTVYGSFGIITTLEIFQHHFSEMGHGTPPVTHTYIKPSSNKRSTTSRVASAAGWLRSSRLVGSDLHSGRNGQPGTNNHAMT